MMHTASFPQPSRVAQIQLPEKLVPVFTTPNKRYRAAKGGRGSGKTRGFALMAAIYGFREAEAGNSGIILCAREFMNSLDDSSMAEVKAAIESVPWLNDYYDIGEKYIRTKNRRVEFKFAGLRHNLDSIKSKARILLAWVDEAEGVSEIAWRKLTPTVREDGSEIWVTWNPESEESATHKRFAAYEDEDVICVTINYEDNPFFPEVLEKERLRDLRISPETYDHVWGGEFLSMTDAQVFRGKYQVKAFDVNPDWDGPYHGLDFGFSQDPSAAVRVYVDNTIKGHSRLLIRHEAGKSKLDLDRTSNYMIESIPGIEDYVIRADSARPESISYLRRHGLPRIVAVDKWKGSVEDGVAHIRSYDEVIIHSECPKTAREFRLYSHKVDPKTGDILPVIVDAHNHWIDATRYALSPLITRKGRGGAAKPRRLQ